MRVKCTNYFQFKLDKQNLSEKIIINLPFWCLPRIISDLLSKTKDIERFGMIAREFNLVNIKSKVNYLL